MKLTKTQKLKLMGRQILVTHRLTRDQKPRSGWRDAIVTWYTYPCQPFVAWIVGFANRQNGEIVGHRVEYGESIPTHFEVSKVVPVMLVRSWPSGPELEVPVWMCESTNLHGLKPRWSGPRYPLAPNTPRNEKGQFCKWTKETSESK